MMNKCELRKNIPYTFFTGEYTILPEGTTIQVAGRPEQRLEKPAALYTDASTKKTLYDGRYCAVGGFVFSIVKGKYCVLANRRGEGTPDFQGYWNCPCGFLERDETSQEGIAREIAEECNIAINPDKLKVFGVQTDPLKCNNGNVTIRHKAFVDYKDIKYVNNSGGEENEVADIKWIPIDEVGKYKWAFGHEETIFLAIEPLWKRCWRKFRYILHI